MTQNEAGERPAAWVDEDAVRAFLAGHGPNGPTDDPEMSWAEEIDGWGEPGSADFAHSFETFLYDLQQHGGGLVLGDGIGDGSTMPVLMEVSTDSSGISDCFLVRVKLTGGAEVTTGTEQLHHLASGKGEAAVLDALDTVAGIVSDAYRGFLRSMAAFRRNEPAAATAELASPTPEVVRVWLHQTTGSAGYSTMWNHAGGPAAGANSTRLLDPDRPSPHDGGAWSAHTVADVEAALLARGLRIVTRAEAASALRAAGYTLGTNRGFGHVLYADKADATTWWTANYNHYAFAVGHPARPEQSASAAPVVGLLACPSCGSTDLASVERGFCRGDITRDADGEVRVDCGESTDWDGQPSIGVQCFTCEWEHLGGDWAKQLVAAQR